MVKREILLYFSCEIVFFRFAKTAPHFFAKFGVIGKGRKTEQLAVVFSICFNHGGVHAVE